MNVAYEGRRADVDPITFSVVLSRFASIANEMTIAIESAAMTSILALCRDYSCCIYDTVPRQVAMVDAIPIHTNSMHLLLKEITNLFGDDIGEGDAFACNYAYAHNTHIGDLVVACPVYHEGHHVFWAVAKGHQLDVGAPVPASASPWVGDIWQEGLQIPPVKFYDRGKPRKDVLNLYLTNVRWRQALEGDLMAMLGSIWTGERRLKELCQEFGIDAIRTYVDEAIDYAGQRMRATIRAMPNGVYTAEGWLDSDGRDRENIAVRCTLTINDEHIEVDFAGSEAQVDTSLNASYAVMQAAGGIPIVMSVDPDIPHNEGCLRCVTVTAPAGSICNAKYPAATACATTIPGDLMQDVVCKALAKAIPGRVRAGNAHWANIPMMSGVDSRSGAVWGHMMLNGGSGGAAANGADGWPLITSSASYGGLKTASVEETELLYPLRFLQWEIEPNSSGLGEYIGGPGIRCAVTPVAGPIEMIEINDGLINPPFGAAGGTAGRGGGRFVEDPAGRRKFLRTASHIALQPGEVWTGVSTGGGGYGNPLERPVGQVRLDVADGIYDSDHARQVYGVVLDESRGGALEAAATETLRRQIAEAGRKHPADAVVPNVPAASTWLKDMMRPGDQLV